MVLVVVYRMDWREGLKLGDLFGGCCRNLGMRLEGFEEGVVWRERGGYTIDWRGRNNRRDVFLDMGLEKGEDISKNFWLEVIK